MNEDPTTSSLPVEAVPAAVNADALSHRGMVVGHFKLLELLGEGGFGVVWLAEQTEPVRRRVALKLIKPGMDSKAVIARFEAERQALAMMNHPNVAKVLDAGTVPQGALAGRPYFVMEHVKGVPITQYCDTHRLTIAQRLKLFVAVCEAIQHAHMKGIIHRDLKPGNILVTIAEGQEPRPVVIDFGVAKALAGRLTEETIFTERGQIIGTPEYMSPEQAEMSEVDIDTRSDVYSLGVILYELLTGAVPFDARTLRAAGYAAIQKIIREEDPPRPSTRLSTLGDSSLAVAAARNAKLEELASQLRRELEWIPLKALRKDRTERYRSASELADDVGNYLAHRPLIAGPESAGYKVRKFVRRNKAGVIAGAAIAASLVLATGISVWFAVKAAQDRAHAVKMGILADEHANEEAKARKRSESINEFVTKALQSGDPQEGGKQDVTIADAMHNAIAEIKSGAFKDEPETEAALKDVIATILMNNGRASEAVPLLVEARDTLQKLHKGDHLDVAKSLNNLANAMSAIGKVDEAEPLNVQALEMYQRLSPGDSADVAGCLNNVAFARQQLGRTQEALPYFEKALEMRKRMHAGDHAEVAESLNNLAGAHQMLGHTARAEPLCSQALDMYKKVYKGDHPDVALTMNNLAFLRDELGHPEQAEPLYVESLAMRRRLFKGDHPAVAAGLNNLAQIRQALGKTTDVEPLFAESLEMLKRMHAHEKGDHADEMMIMSNLADLRKELGRPAEAEPLLREALAMARRMNTGDHPDTASCLSNLALLLQETGRAADADPLIKDCLEMRRRIFEGDHPATAVALHNMGLVKRDLGQKVEAEKLLADSVEMSRRIFGKEHPDHPSIANTLSNLAEVRNSLGKAADARRDIDEAVAMLRRGSGGGGTSPGSVQLASALSTSAGMHAANGDAKSAVKELEEALAIGEKAYSSDHPKLKRFREALEKCRDTAAK